MPEVTPSKPTPWLERFREVCPWIRVDQLAEEFIHRCQVEAYLITNNIRSVGVLFSSGQIGIELHSEALPILQQLLNDVLAGNVNFLEEGEATIPVGIHARILTLSQQTGIAQADFFPDGSKTPLYRRLERCFYAQSDTPPGPEIIRCREEVLSHIEKVIEEATQICEEGIETLYSGEEAYWFDSYLESRRRREKNPSLSRHRACADLQVELQKADLGKAPTRRIITNHEKFANCAYFKRQKVIRYLNRLLLGDTPWLERFRKVCPSLKIRPLAKVILDRCKAKGYKISPNVNSMRIQLSSGTLGMNNHRAMVPILEEILEEAERDDVHFSPEGTVPLHVATYELIQLYSKEAGRTSSSFFRNGSGDRLYHNLRNAHHKHKGDLDGDHYVYCDPAHFESIRSQLCDIFESIQQELPELEVEHDSWFDRYAERLRELDPSLNRLKAYQCLKFALEEEYGLGECPRRTTVTVAKNFSRSSYFRRPEVILALNELLLKAR